jgi:hypothetical protein
LQNTAHLIIVYLMAKHYLVILQFVEKSFLTLQISVQDLVLHNQKLQRVDRANNKITLENSHPFIRELWGRHWIFAHNGDLHDFNPPLSGRN